SYGMPTETSLTRTRILRMFSVPLQTCVGALNTTSKKLACVCEEGLSTILLRIKEIQPHSTRSMSPRDLACRLAKLPCLTSATRTVGGIPTESITLVVLVLTRTSIQTT